MGYNKVFKLVLSIFTFIFYLMGFFIPHKVFIGMSKFAIFLYYKPLFIILFIVLLILFSIVIISIVKNSKFSSRAYLFTSTLMLVLSLYCVYDGIFNIETYFEYYTIIGIAPFLMLIISIWSFLFYFYEEKIFAYFIKKRKINHLIGKMIRIFFAILILFAFITPLSIADLSSLSASWDIRRTIILAHDRGLINFILLILYYGFVLIFSKKLNLKIINTTSFILVKIGR